MNILNIDPELSPNCGKNTVRKMSKNKIRQEFILKF